MTLRGFLWMALLNVEVLDVDTYQEYATTIPRVYWHMCGDTKRSLNPQETIFNITSEEDKARENAKLKRVLCAFFRKLGMSDRCFHTFIRYNIHYRDR